MLNSSLQQIPDISYSEIKKLKQLKLKTIADLLHYYPKQHIIFKRTRISEIKPDETVTIVGKLMKHQIINPNSKPNLTLQKWFIRDKRGQITVTQFYNHHYYKSNEWRSQQQNLYHLGAIIIVTGKAKQDRYGYTVIDNPTHIQVTDLESAKVTKSSIIPIYPLTKGVTNELIHRCTVQAIQYSQFIEDPIPQGLRQYFNLIELETAITNIHLPTNSLSLEKARHRLVFDEFFYMVLAMLQRRQILRNKPSLPMTTTGKLINRFLNILPFPLTNAQAKVINEILQDLQQSQPMNRLVQGDVGSGKTVVATIAALSTIESGYQVALMVPTEVLAQQHYHKISSWFEQLKIESALLTSSTPAKQKQQIYQDLESGKLPLVIGTHALFQEQVKFSQLGLVLIDEQHRFGVIARDLLQRKGSSPHVLTMTATPIPRTLALTIHSDLDISQIDELPPGRQPITTKVLTGKTRDKAYSLIRREVSQGRQAYIIFPLIDESEKLENIRAAVSEHQRLQNEIFPDSKVGLLHGQMTTAEKQAALANFHAGKTPILISTTVVEVGVDSPNATIIVIEHAERFGLAQLHQLRGRVGRGTHQSYCFLISDSTSTNSRERLLILERSQDGFYLAEKDLQLRGYGQLIGTQQHGMPRFALADLSQDQEVLDLAYQAAKMVLKKDPFLQFMPLLQQELLRRLNSSHLDTNSLLN